MPFDPSPTRAAAHGGRAEATAGAFVQPAGGEALPRVGLAGLSGDLLVMARDALAAEGCEATVCSGAEELLAGARNGAFDLVLADVDALAAGPVERSTLNVETAIGELTAHVKSAAPQTMVLVLSSDGSAAAPVAALRTGACDYLQKPLRIEELRTRLRHALANRRLGLSVRQRALQLAFVTLLSEHASASLDLREVLGAAVGGLRAFVDFDLAVAVLRNEAANSAIVQPLTPEAKALWQAEAAVPLEESVLAWNFDGGRPRALPGRQREELPRELAPLQAKGFRSVLLLPLISKGQTIGVVALASRRGEAFSESDLDLLRQMGDHLSSAVMNARLYGEVKALSTQLEEAVRERTTEALGVKRYLESLLEMAGDAIITVDLERRITSWNQGAREILGYSKDEVHGRDLGLLASGEGARDQLVDLTRLASSGQVSSNVETSWLRKDRKEVNVSLTVSPIVGGPQQLVGALVIARDVTERRHLQEELFHSEKLASIGQLAAGVAHQINNPLGAISGRAQMLLRLSGPPHEDFLREQLAKIRADCARIAETVNDLLGFARKTETVKQYSDINTLLDETLEVVQHGLTARKAQIARRYGERLPPVLASANHLRQLFANLMTNAFDAMPDGGTLTIASVFRPSDADHPEQLVEVAFADTGIGIPEEDLPRIFEPFFTTKPPGQGTGLGLAVAKRIVTFHSGRIDVESQVGVGTTFTVQFPV